MLAHSSQKYISYIFTIILAVLTGACGSSSSLKHPTTSATFWVQNAAEYKALTTSTYQIAASKLPLAIEDSYWTAYAPQEDRDDLRKLPMAVVLDVDETVLDNSPYQARMIIQNSDFDLEQWNNWVMEAKADAIAGAVEFTNRADEKGISVFYLTNREAKVEEGTRKNLKELGFPVNEEEDRILSNKERDNWTSAKKERRAHIAEDYRILMFFGDDLNDFISAKNISREERDEIVAEHKDKWGNRWFILPNPVYGSWENALYDFDDSLSPGQIDSVKKARLNPKNES